MTDDGETAASTPPTAGRQPSGGARFTPRPQAARTLAVAGALWSVVFAVTHVYWAMGGRLGLASDMPAITERPWFLAYDIASAVVFFAAAAIGAALASDSGTPRTRRWLLTLTFWGAIVALLRGVIGLVQDTIALLAGPGLEVGALYDIWFTVAGVLFLLVARGLRAAERAPSAA